MRKDEWSYIAVTYSNDAGSGVFMPTEWDDGGVLVNINLILPLGIYRAIQNSPTSLMVIFKEQWLHASLVEEA